MDPGSASRKKTCAASYGAKIWPVGVPSMGRATRTCCCGLRTANNDAAPRSFRAAPATPAVGDEHAANCADARVFEQRRCVVDHRRIAIPRLVFEHEETQLRKIEPTQGVTPEQCREASTGPPNRVFDA